MHVVLCFGCENEHIWPHRLLFYGGMLKGMYMYKARVTLALNNVAEHSGRLLSLE